MKFSEDEIDDLKKTIKSNGSICNMLARLMEAVNDIEETVKAQSIFCATLVHANERIEALEGKYAGHQHHVGLEMPASFVEVEYDGFTIDNSDLTVPDTDEPSCHKCGQVLALKGERDTMGKMMERSERLIMDILKHIPAQTLPTELLERCTKFMNSE
jgi:hypothetical protein